ncbi:HAD family hydrolase [Pontibacter sp. JAM-7]|uniref:HAD family hydrolase n=1 Tax=Pontibacter sp. JAM-7 TaxID=3366581 RepID=UPI003AF5FFC8
MQSLHEKTCWVFDLDGTLTQAIHDFDHIRAVLDIAPGQDILAALEAMPSSEQARATLRLDELERHYAEQAQPADGVLECLSLLHQRQCHMGILTRNRRDLALLSLQAIGLDKFFTPDTVLGRDEIAPKPAPDGIHYLLSQWQASPETAVMVGDFHYDLLCGRAAQVYTVHVSDDGRHWPADTDLRVSNLQELALLLH